VHRVGGPLRRDLRRAARCRGQRRAPACPDRAARPDARRHAARRCLRHRRLPRPFPAALRGRGGRPRRRDAGGRPAQAARRPTARGRHGRLRARASIRDRRLPRLLDWLRPDAARAAPDGRQPGTARGRRGRGPGRAVVHAGGLGARPALGGPPRSARPQDRPGARQLGQCNRVDPRHPLPRGDAERGGAFRGAPRDGALHARRVPSGVPRGWPRRRPRHWRAAWARVVPRSAARGLV
ncbi:MAG: hypothetical protein AVDCRST_MAG19-2203, partial [uncultured Thermomicrobiales bacterium]